MGLRPGDRIGIWSPNNAEAVITQLATGKAGLTLVTINPACRRAELEYSLNKVGCKALITAASFKTSNYLNIPSELTPEIAACPPGHLVSARVPCLTTLIYIGADALGCFRFEKVPAVAGPHGRAELARIAVMLDNRDPINVRFASGTTGSPKGSSLSRRNLVNNACFIPMSRSRLSMRKASPLRRAKPAIWACWTRRDNRILLGGLKIWQSGRPLRRGAMRVGTVEASRHRDRGRHPGLLQGSYRALQNPPVHPVCGSVCDEHYGQDAEIRDAQPDRRDPGVNDKTDCVSQFWSKRARWVD